jgi:asparagine synthase (glutamine-hydrolysing)
MCGIYGGSPDLISDQASELLRHRGPDQHGNILIRTRDGRELLIGQTRLSVVYKKDVQTPMQRDGASIVYNGEIYNWAALRRELEGKGWRFETPTDTELVLCAYLEWGPACLDRFNGMFAFAIWHNDHLFLARDRLGKKPLFYTHGPQGLAFASELKVIRGLELQEVPICQALEFYFDEHTPFKDVKSVRPGEYLVYTPSDNRLRHRAGGATIEQTIDDEKWAVGQLSTCQARAAQDRRRAGHDRLGGVIPRSSGW